MEPPHERAAGYLRMTWTPTDQAIMEHLLLEEQQRTPAAVAPASSNDSSPSKPPSPSSPEGWRSSRPSSESDKSAVSKSGRSKPTRADPKADEDRRARHRAVQRRFVQRKKEEFQRTKRLAQELEAKYKLLRIAAEERELRYEQATLAARASAAEKTAAVAAAPCTISVSNPVDELIAKQLELVREFYEPVTAKECSAIQHSNQQEYEVSLTRDEPYTSSGLTIMGWHDHRKMDDASVKLALSKEFPNVRALDLMDRTWLSLTSPATYARFFSPILTIKMQVLQVLSRDAIVIHRVLYHPQTQRASNSLEMLWRARVGREYVIFDACLQNNGAQRCLGESYNWTQMTTTMAFSPTPSDGCLLRHGGWLRRFAVSSVRFWLMEMLFMALRFESVMVSPVFALPCNDAPASEGDEIEIML